MIFIKRNKLTFLILFIAIIFLAIGVWRGEIETVYRKAVNICMECIGLG